MATLVTGSSAADGASKPVLQSGLVSDAGSELMFNEPVSFSKMSTGPAHCEAETVWTALKTRPVLLKQFTRFESFDGSTPAAPFAWMYDFHVDCVPEPSWAEKTRIGAFLPPT